MTVFRRSRFIWWIIRDLARRYTRALIGGFVIGFILSYASWKYIPLLLPTIIVPEERIGIVGDYSPSKIPLSIQEMISGGLTTVSEDGTPMPGLAESWEATDSGKTFVFKLRSDFLWHSGKEVDAMDINYQIRQATLTVTDPHMVAIKLDSPFAPLPILVSRPLFLKGLIGFGPYVVERSILKGDKLHALFLKARKNNLPRRIIRFYLTENQAETAFKRGEIDWINEMESADQFRNWPNVIAEKTSHHDRIVAILFNVKDRQLAEKSFRQGLGYLLPDFTDERATGPIPKTSWVYNPKVRIFNHNKEQAAKLLKEFVASESAMTLSTFPSLGDTANLIAKSWTEGGIKTDVKIEQSTPQNFQALLMVIEVPQDPDQYSFWHSTQTANTLGYVNVKIDKLLEDGRQELNPDKRKELYMDFQRRLVDDAPALFLTYQSTWSVRRK